MYGGFALLASSSLGLYQGGAVRNDGVLVIWGQGRNKSSQAFLSYAKPIAMKNIINLCFRQKEFNSYKN